MSKTNIPWCDEVWNPTTGCSFGCPYCYARELHNKRNEAWRNGWEGAPAQYHVPFDRVQLFPERLEIPLRKKKPAVFFVNSMGDFFDPDVPDDFRDRAYAVMSLCPQHTFLVLTKRAEGMADYWARGDEIYNRTGVIQVEAYKTNRRIGTGQPFNGGLSNCWHGVTAENQQAAEERIPHLLRVPGKRFLSIEPMLGPVDLDRPTPGPDLHQGGGQYICQPWFIQSGIHAVILGGESGPNARPMHPDWVRSIVHQCKAACVPVFVKQMGTAWAKENGVKKSGNDISLFPEDLQIRELPWHE